MAPRTLETKKTRGAKFVKKKSKRAKEYTEEEKRNSNILLLYS